MFKKIIHYLAAALVFLLPGASAVAQNIFSEYALRVQHHVSISMNQSLIVNVAPLNFGSSTAPPLVDASAKHSVSDLLSEKKVVPKYFGDSTKSRDEILRIANAELFDKDTRGLIGAALLAELRKNGMSNATYIYNQQVYPIGKTNSGVFSLLGQSAGDRPMTLTWSVSARLQDGAIFSTAASIEDPVPSIVHARYYSLKYDEELGESFKFEKAGVLEFQLRSPNGIALGDLVSIQTMGEFDPNNEAEADVLTGFQCIIKNEPGCPAGNSSVGVNGYLYPDIFTQIGATGSLSGILDYHYPVMPKSSNIDLDGDGFFTDEVTIEMTVRDFSSTSCSTGEYRNAGHIMRSLIERIDRFTTFSSNIGPHLVNSVANDTASLKSYDKTISIDGDSDGIRDAGIYPFDSLFVDGPNDSAIQMPHDSLMSLDALRQIGMTVIPPIKNMKSPGASSAIEVTAISPGASFNTSGLVSEGYIPEIHFTTESLGRSFSPYNFSLDFDVRNKDYLSNVYLDDIYYNSLGLLYVNGIQVMGGPHDGTSQLNFVANQETMVYDACMPSGTNKYECGNYRFYIVSSDVPEGRKLHPEITVSAKWCTEGRIKIVDYFNVERLELPVCELLLPNTGMIEYRPGFFAEMVDRDVRAGPINITSLLRNGQNKIELKVLSAGNGRFDFNIKARSCLD